MLCSVAPKITGHMFLFSRRLNHLKQVVSCRSCPAITLSKVLFHLSFCRMENKSKLGLDADRPFTVFVEGNIGSGKTTFLSYFDGKHADVHSEPTDVWRNIRGHNILQLIYEDPTRWAFTFQSLVQKTMLELHLKHTNDLPIKLMERSIYSARYCFVENLHKEGFLSDPDYAVLDEWFKWIISNMKISGDLIVYLRTDPEIAYQRIQERGRKEESALNLDYLKKLHDLHDDWLIDNKVFSASVPVLTLDANKSLAEVIKEFQTYESDIINSISVKHRSRKSVANENSPSKMKHILIGNPAEHNIILNSTGL